MQSEQRKGFPLWAKILVALSGLVVAVFLAGAVVAIVTLNQVVQQVKIGLTAGVGDVSARARWDTGVLVADVECSGVHDPSRRLTVTDISLANVSADETMPKIGHKPAAFKLSFSKYKGNGDTPAALKITYETPSGRESGNQAITIGIPPKPSSKPKSVKK